MFGRVVRKGILGIFLGSRRGVRWRLEVGEGFRKIEIREGKMGLLIVMLWGLG